MSEEPIIKIDEMAFYENDFEMAIEEACEKYKIEDLVKEGQTRWKAVMHYVGKRIFPDNKILRDRQTVWLEGNKIPTNNNRYNYYILNILCDYYIQLSRRYNKLISSVAFSEFVNIPVDNINQWGQDMRSGAREASSPSCQIWKKLQDDREDSLKDKAVDSGNVMGVFQVGRREYQWDMPGVRAEQEQRRVLTADQLPDLRGELCENNTQLRLSCGENETVN